MTIFPFFLGIWLAMAQANTPAPVCECNDEGPFLTVARQTQLVSLVKVTKYLSFKNIYNIKTPMSMEVEIIDIYKGKEKRKQITVWGDPGNLCRPYLSGFKEGEYYVIAFYPGSEGNGHADEKATDYSISICGTFWLTADPGNKIAKGNIGGNKQSLKLDEIKSELTRKNH